MKILAIEDGGFRTSIERIKKRQAYLVGVLISDFRIDDVIISRIVVDGLDATERLFEIVKYRSPDIDVIMLASVTYGGFNLVDIKKVNNKYNIPVIIANSKKACKRSVEKAVKKHFLDWRKRLTIVKRTGKSYALKIDTGGTIHFYVKGISLKEARKLIIDLTVFGNRPEPLRIARLIAHGLGMVKE